MSTSILYHGFKINGYHHINTTYQQGAMVFTIERPVHSLRCSKCKGPRVHRRGGQLRWFHTLPIGKKQIYVRLYIPRVFCSDCQLVRQINLGFADSRRTYTKAFERYVIELSRHMTIKDVANHLDVGWDLVKGIQRRYLTKYYFKPRLKDLSHVAVDEISVGKNHKYLTVVLDLPTGAVVFVGDGKGAESLEPFWKRLKRSGAKIEAVAIDMSPSYISAVMDTVFPVDSPFNYCREHDGKISGPGVIDMKGGLVTVIFAIKALAEKKLLDHIPLTFICNSDEEIGSPNSRTLISQEASKSLFALVFECGGLNGEVVTGRKGKAGYRLEVRGQAGHAAFAGPDKASAIHELAKKIIALEQLNDYQKKIVVNVGVVKGGIGPNSVADFAEAEIDTRFLGMADAQLLAEKIDQIASKCTVPGTRSQLHKRSGRMPMEQTDANRYLHKLVQKQAGYLGVPCVEELRSGVSDANNIAEHGIPVIDGMGPIGDCDHSDREYMIKDSLPARTKLAVLSILAGWDHSNNQ